MSPPRPIRVLHCLDVVGGHPPQLARAERELGVDSRCVNLLPNPYGYAADETLARLGDGLLRNELRRAHLLWRALREFDVVHFNFGSSIFPLVRQGGGLFRVYQALVAMRDLELLRSAGKALFVTYQGDDARQGDYCRANFPIHFAHDVGADYYLPGTDDLKRKSIARFARAAHRIYALVPDLLHVLPPGARYLPYASADPREWGYIGARPRAGEPLHVVHAPSHRGAKGTAYLVNAVSELRSRGIALRLTLVEGLPRADARRIYETADVVVDQLVGRWYAGIGVEAMALGKPTLAYISESDAERVPAEMRRELPVINAQPATIAEVLASLATSARHTLPALGQRSRAFVEKWHDPRKVAATLIAEYRAALAA